MFRIGRAQRAFDLAVEAIEWSGLKKDIRSDLTVNLQVDNLRQHFHTFFNLPSKIPIGQNYFRFEMGGEKSKFVVRLKINCKSNLKERKNVRFDFVGIHC